MPPRTLSDRTFAASTLVASAALLLFGIANASSSVAATETETAPAAPQASDGAPRPFPDASLDDWKERSFSGNTDYALVDKDGVRALRGHARSSASILYREREVDLRKTPLLAWSWKIDRVYDAIDERVKAGDDYPARLYVVVKTGFLPWETLALNYVWSSTGVPGESWPNPFTDKATMIVVRGGPDDVGRWVHERRDVVADFRAAYGKQVDGIDGYAVMVDGDNGKREATAWFGDIAFLPAE